MSDSTTLTRCPHCQTRFRVTEQQLGVASGKVRCGNCMEVFNARDHAVADSAPSPGKTAARTPASSPAASSSRSSSSSPAEPAATPAPGTPSEDVFSDEDEFLFQDNPEEDSLDDKYNRSDRADDDLSDSFLALDQDGNFEDDSDDKEQADEVDESWADAILDDDAPLSARPETETPRETPKTDRPVEAQRSPEHDRKAFDSAAPPVRRPQEQPLKAPSPEPARKSPEALSLSAERDDRRPGNVGSNSWNDGKPRKAPTPKSSPYDNLRSTPVAAGRGNRGWGMNLLWALGCLLLLAFVASQLFYFQFDRLSRYEPLRPLYTTVCPLVGCELPEMVDTDLIDSRKLVVRSHPDEPKALLVEAVIVNQAPFAQPFPAIVLTFSNLNNDIVAQRAFKPAEYLAGDALDLSSMPPSTPVKIALELRDPGQDAVNYNLRFLPARREGQP